MAAADACSRRQDVSRALAQRLNNFVGSTLLLPYNSVMKVRAVLRMIEEDGWYLARTRGSHRQYKHPEKPGLVTVAGKLSEDLAPGTVNSIQKQAGLK